MHKAEGRESGAARMMAGALLGGLLALGVELIVLLLGAYAISHGILKEDVSVQLTAAACVIGGIAGGWLTCSWWPSRRFLAGLSAGLICFLLIATIGLLWGEAFTVGIQALVEMAGCLCGGAISGLLFPSKKRKKKGGSRVR